MSAEGWRIQRDRRRCEKPGCPLRGRAEIDYFAVLELPDCVRRDLCAPCFRERTAEEGEHLVFWKVHRPEKQGPVLDLASLRRLFDVLGEEQPEDRRGIAAELRYLVALLLVRKRVLKLVDPADEAEESADLVVEDPRRTEAGRVALRAPEMNTERLEALKGELLAALDGDPAEAVDGRRES